MYLVSVIVTAASKPGRHHDTHDFTFLFGPVIPLCGYRPGRYRFLLLSLTDMPLGMKFSVAQPAGTGASAPSERREKNESRKKADHLC